MRTILRHIPVKPLVDIVLDYATDLRPIMNNVLHDIQVISQHESSIRMLSYARYHKQSPIDKTGSDMTHAVLLSKFGAFTESYKRWRSNLCKYDDWMLPFLLKLER